MVEHSEFCTKCPFSQHLKCGGPANPLLSQEPARWGPSAVLGFWSSLSPVFSLDQTLEVPAILLSFPKNSYFCSNLLFVFWLILYYLVCRLTFPAFCVGKLKKKPLYMASHSNKPFARLSPAPRIPYTVLQHADLPLSTSGHVPDFCDNHVLAYVCVPRQETSVFP